MCGLLYSSRQSYVATCRHMPLALCFGAVSCAVAWAPSAAQMSCIAIELFIYAGCSVCVKF